METFFTIPEFAKILKISNSMAYQIIKQEKLNLLSLGPRLKRISGTQIKQLVKKFSGETNSLLNDEQLVYPTESEFQNENL